LFYCFCFTVDELPHYQIQQFHDYGVQSEDFIHSTLFTFRKTVYLSRADSARVNAAGTGRASVASFEAYILLDRFSITAANSYDASIADNIMVIDRSGYLGGLLLSGKAYAEKGSTMNMGMVFHGAPQFNFSVTYQPSILHGLSMLGRRPTVGSILAANVAGMVATAATRGAQETPTASEILKSHWSTLDMLGFFEKLNLISFVWTDKTIFLAKKREGKRVVNRYTNVKSKGSAAAMELVAEEEEAAIRVGKAPQATTLAESTAAVFASTSRAKASSKSPLEFLKKTLKGKKRSESDETAAARVEVAVSGSGTGEASKAEFESKVAQLRAMGISESIIAQTIAKFDGDQKASGSEQDDPTLVREPLAPVPRSELKDVSAKAKNKAKSKEQSKGKAKKPAKKKSTAKFVPVVVAPQTKEELLASKRDPACAMKGSAKGGAHCPDTFSPTRNRVSAELTSVSAMKVKFDLNQLRYIALMDTLNAPAIVSKVLPKLQNINKLIGNFLKYTAIAATKQSFHLTENEVATLSDGALNRAIHIAKDPLARANSAASKVSILKEEAKRSLQASDLDVGEADFMVLDMVVNVQTMRAMAAILLTSTVWFDSMNGQAVGAHHDDGLVHKIFPKFCQEVADTLSHSYPYNVHKYFAVAMDLSPVEQFVSPLFMAEPDELIVVTWVNPNAIPADDETETDGLFVFDGLAYEALPDEVAHVNPSVHPDFLTDIGNNFSTFDQAVSTEIQSELFKSAVTRELIQRHSNRLVLIPPRRPFFFSTSNRVDGSYKENLSRKAFDQKTTIAMVIVMKKA